jgi:O-antigen/teichoic acid export membrane protein
MGSTKKVLLNTIVTYARTVFGVCLSLFSSRWVIEYLGESDFGLYTLVGAIIVFVTFLNAALSAGTSRYFAFYLDNDDNQEVNRWFNVSLSIHIVLPIVLIMISWPLGEHIIRGILVIAANRIEDAVIVFRFSLLSAFFSMVSVPFIAMYTAKQQFMELAFAGLLYSFFIFLSAFLLRYIYNDRLTRYTMMMVISSIVIQFFQILRALFIFIECRIDFKHWFNRERYGKLLSFSLWNLCGNLGHLLKMQGMALLANIFFGTKGNAGLGIANQVANQTNILASSLDASALPEIVRNEGMGNRARALYLARLTSKLGTILILLLTVPVLVEIDNILKIWLISPPEYSVILCRFMIIMYIIEKTTLGQESLLRSIGKIKVADSGRGIIYSLTIVLAYIFIKKGVGIISIGYSCVITMIFSRFPVLFEIKRHYGIPIFKWVTQNLFPYMIITLIVIAVSLLIRHFMEESLLRILSVFIANMFICGILAWFVLFDTSDKEIIFKKIKRK